MDDPILEPPMNKDVLSMDLPELTSILAGYLLQIADAAEHETKIECFGLLQAMFFQEPKFDKAVIFMFRKMTKNFLLINREATMNGLPFSLLGMADGMELEPYIDAYVMRMQEDA